MPPPFTPFMDTSAAFAAVLRRVDGHGLSHLAGRPLLPVSAAAHGIDAAKDERRHIAAALVDGGLDDAVVQGPCVAIVADGHGGADLGFGDRRQGIIGRVPARPGS